MKQRKIIRTLLSTGAIACIVAAVSMAFAESSKRTSVAIPVVKTQPASIVSPRPSKIASKSLVAPTTNLRQALASKKKPLQKTGTLNLNTASALELTKLPGVGPKKAQRIVLWRSKHGKFHRVLDLRRVKGFGAKSLKKLSPYLRTIGPNTLH